MNLVTLEGVSKQYSERRLLEEVSLRINEGDRIGLIGVNGSGKTTLLRIVAGQEQADQGTVTIWGGLRVEYLAQEPHLEGDLSVLDYIFAGDAPQLRLLRKYRQASASLALDPSSLVWQEKLTEATNEMDRTGGWAAEANAKAILSRLGIDDFSSRLDNLSGGQGKRVALARALIDRADLLILDEPTNHIDAEAIAWLEGYLTTVPGALLMVTHDRYFLDRVVNRIVELDRRELVEYPGNYRRYLELRTVRQERLAVAEQKRQNLLRRELAWLRRGAMARSTKQKARKTRIEELQGLQYDSGNDRVAMALAGRRLGKKVLEGQGLKKSFGDLHLFADVDFSLVRGDRIGILGPNGAGKSTFLNVLAGVLEPDGGSVVWGETVELGYYDQLAHDLDHSKRVIDFINDRAPLIRTKDGGRVEAAQMLEWFLFPRPQQQAYISSLSGGERRRLYLLSILIRQPNVLFLDEPTNDLDIQTLTVLEEFLDHLQGCLVVVSHDRYFLDRNVDYLATFEDGSLSSRYPAPYEAFRQRQKEQAPQAIDGNPAVKHPRPGRDSKPERQETSEKRRKLTWKEARELEALEDQIDQLESKKMSLEEEANQAGGDYEVLNKVAEQLAAVEADLESKLKRWFDLSELTQ